MRLPRISAFMRVAHNMFTNTIMSDTMDSWVRRIHNEDDWTAEPDAKLSAALRREGIRLSECDLLPEERYRST